MTAPGATPPTGYDDPDRYRWAGSMEGLPEWVDPLGPVDERPWHERLHALLDDAAVVLPGAVLAAALAAGAHSAAQWIGEGLLGFERTPLSPILVAIAFGFALRNAIGVPDAYLAGIRFCLQRLLRIGVALLGLRLGLAALGSIGIVALPIAALSIVAALAVVAAVNRALGLPRRLGTLVACGTAICGNSAIVALASTIDAEEDEVSYAVACVTLFGLLGLVAYPFVAHALFAGDAHAAGLFLGIAIHDTAQVAGAALLSAQLYAQPETLDVAMVTKLVRNLSMVLVIPALTILYRRRGRAGGTRLVPPLQQAVPGFIVAFVAFVALRTLGDLGPEPFFGFVAADTWALALERAATVSTGCLMIAMGAVGLGTDLARLRRLGLRPFAVGLVAALTVAAVGGLAIRTTFG